MHARVKVFREQRTRDKAKCCANIYSTARYDDDDYDGGVDANYDEMIEYEAMKNDFVCAMCSHIGTAITIHALNPKL